MDFSIVWTLAQKELRDALRNRWFVLFTLVFAALAFSFAYLSVAGAGTSGIAGFARTAASLVNLVLLIVPLLALTVGAAILFARGWLATGLVLLVLSTPLDLVARRLATLRLKPLPARMCASRSCW